MRFSRPQEEDFRPELTPLVDVVFQLIIFFMVSSVFITYTRQMNIETPESNGKPATEQVSKNKIEITKEKKIYLNGEELPLEELAQKLRSATDIHAVVIHADKNLSYGLVMKILEICDRAGINDIRTTVQ